jgi:hypothetical protein
LIVGPHDFTLSAQGAASYAFRMAAGEIVLDMQSSWVSIVSLYAGGGWPCGRMKDGRIVVF